MAGSPISTTQAVGVAGQSVKIDTIAPAAPTLVLPADLPLIDGRPTFSRAAATTKGFNVKAEAGSTIEVTVKSLTKPDSSGYTNSVIATGELQNILPTDADLTRIGSTLSSSIPSSLPS